MIEAAVTKTAESAIEKLSSTASKMPGVGSESDFSKLIDSMGLSPEKQLSTQAISAEGLDIKTSQVNGQDMKTNGKVMELLEGANRNALQMDGMIDFLNSGSQINARQMLHLQMCAGEIMVQTEMTSKIAEQGSNSIKTLLQTNVA